MPASLRWSLVVVTATLGLVVAAWAVDGLIHDGEVPRNTAIAGRAIGGLGSEALRVELEGLAAQYAATPLAVATPSRSFEATAGEWGISLDIEATFTAAMEADDGNPLESFSSWIGGFASDREGVVVFTVDTATTADAVAAQPGVVDALPIDPSFQAVGGTIEVSTGREGRRLEAAAVTSALTEAVAGGTLPATVDVPWTPLEPRFGAAELDSALAEAASLIAAPIPVRINERTTVIPPETARRWIRSSTESGTLGATFDETVARTDLAIRLADLATTGTPPEFTVVDGELSVQLGAPVLVCCEAPVAEIVEMAARTGEIAVLAARLRDNDGGQAVADSFGIRQPIAEFTTNHSCCGSRVDNIHRMADLVRGAIIEPGATFSINEYVGKRTIENGFKSAGAVERGHLVQDVGGGVSQFATTLFNAAFFAGLDFADYQSHTINFSRYPRGREATLGHPAPDLALTNNSPHAVLIWPSYTDTSITVQLWSTPYFTVEQTGQSSSGWGTACTRVDTFRQRTTPDGTVLEDSVFATYRPAEGIDCLGNRIPPPRP